jgi:aminotransferase
MTKVYQQSATCVNAFSQGGALEALRNPLSRQETLKMAAGYRERCELITRLMLESGFFTGFLPPHGAFYVFPSYTFKKPSLEVATLLLEKAHIATVPGSAFGECGEGHLRFAYSTSFENINEAFSRIKEIAHYLD